MNLFASIWEGRRQLHHKLYAREEVERRFGSPARVETYRLTNGELIDFCFYRKPRSPRLWRRLLRIRESGYYELILAFRSGYTYPSLFGGRRLYRKLSKTSECHAVWIEPGSR